MGNESSSSSKKLRSFDGGRIFVNLPGNMLSVSTGQVVTGTVNIDLKTPMFETEELTIGIYGTEDVDFNITTYEGTGKHRKTIITPYKDHILIVNNVYPLFKFVDGAPRPGQYSYPFSLMIPDWLPASMMLGGHD